MSTAGKVLIVLFLLTSLIWIVLASDVSKYNTNGNTKLHELTVQVEKLESELDQTQHDIATLLDQTAQTQEEVDREFTLLRARQTDVEKARSQIQETLSRAQYELATLQETVRNAQSTLEHRNVEQQEETKALARARSDVQTLIADSGQLMDRLTTLRKDFQTTYQASVEMLGKLGRSQDGERGGAH
jgi:chromosome segregation ATPase